MTEHELYEYLRNEVNALQNVVVTEDFINERNTKKLEFEESDNKRKSEKDDRRDDKTRFMHADCIFLEYILITTGKVRAAIDKVHDFLLSRYATDIKVVSSPYLYVPPANIPWMQKAILAGLLTHILIVRMFRPNEKKSLIAGDKVSFQFVELVLAQHVLDNLETYITKSGRITKRYRYNDQ